MTISALHLAVIRQPHAIGLDRLQRRAHLHGDARLHVARMDDLGDLLRHAAHQDAGLRLDEGHVAARASARSPPLRGR